ncbi:MAG: type II toxin-antitoxin system PemK/MazF family toxin, partial [Propionibacteriaceae bacterium]
GITVAYPGDFTGLLAVDYQPEKDGDVDPGEVVWSWVPFEEDHSKGKDRPVLIVGCDGDWLLGLPLSSKNHQLDKEQEAAERRYWVSVGHGPWDAGNHTSSVRVNRVIRVAPTSVRRIGGQLSKQHFCDVLDGLEAHYSGGVTGRQH